MDIKMKLADLKDLTDNNRIKYKNSYIETLVIQSKFDSIYSFIEENNLNIKPLLKEISVFTKKHYRYKTAKKLKIMLNTNISLLDKKELQTILLELNSTIITELHYDIDLTNLKANRIHILVAPDGKEVKLGDTYKVRIIFAAVDSTNPPYITFKNQTIKMTDGVGYLQVKAEKKGINESMGIVNLMSTEDGTKRQFPFKFEFNAK